MTLKLYSTLTQQLEDFHPLVDGEVRMYTCGPTVHDFAHVGNFRTFVVQDLLRRYIRYKGYKLTHVMNITDVDDNTIGKSKAAGLTLQAYTERYTEAFLEDMRTLKIEQPEIMPRATHHIDQMVDLILKLRAKGHTYQSEGSTYFRINSFPAYGRLANLEDLQPQATERVDTDKYSKENPRDFVLWKARKEDETYWDTPLGPGRPGWHIECSAMSMHYLGDTFDIHCGGADLVFPHHENEIAQSEAATDKPFVRYWVHCEFLMVEGEKMSKSLGNFYTLRDLLEKGCSPLALRYLLQSVHYRKQLNFTFDGVEQSQAAIQRVNDFLIRVREVSAQSEDNPDLAERVAQARLDFEKALDDDLNTSAALAALFQLVREANLLLQEGRAGGRNREDILKFFADANRIFDVFQVEEQLLGDENISQLIEARRQARLSRDFQRADAIRAELAGRGIVLEDTKEGTRWKRLNG
jgi:cysteinyl-tRNA synthetase